MYPPDFHGRSDAERRANDHTRLTTLLASVSMLTLGLSLSIGPVPGTPSTAVPKSLASAAGQVSSTGTLPAVTGDGSQTARTASGDPDSKDARA